MALIFHEGIPGCGKTYEAIFKHLIPALKKGRHVFARINGLNFEHLATLAGISLERCKELLHHVEEEQVKTIDQVAMPIGSLVLIDEIQNYFPDTRGKLSDGVTKFVAEQRHKGLDIIAISQDLKDVHKIWRRRVDQKVLFHKLDMLGSKKYRWKLYKAVGPEKFNEVSSGTEEYDPAVYGSYKSFEAGAEDAQKYDDARASIWSSPLFRRVLPFFLAVAAFAIYYVFQLFKGGGLESKLGGTASKTPTTATASASASSASAGASLPSVSQKKYERDLIEDLSEKYRLRVSGVIQSAEKITAIFEWYDEGLHVKERLTMRAIARRGYDVMVDAEMQTATLTKGKVRYVATQFPLEGEANVSDARQRQVSGGAGGYNAPAGGYHPSAQGSPYGAGAAVGDGFGVLGKSGPGIRQPGTEAFNGTANKG
jgi:zona occludens toxin